MLLWLLLTAMALGFVAVDIRSTPIPPVMKWGRGSAMHGVAGDGLGILAGAVIDSYLTLSRPLELVLEYGLGFGFGWTILQALFMRGMAGGSYRRALATTLVPEFLSMNFVMSGMMLVAKGLTHGMMTARGPAAGTMPGRYPRRCPRWCPPRAASPVDPPDPAKRGWRRGITHGLRVRAAWMGCNARNSGCLLHGHVLTSSDRRTTACVSRAGRRSSASD